MESPPLHTSRAPTARDAARAALASLEGGPASAVVVVVAAGEAASAAADAGPGRGPARPPAPGTRLLVCEDGSVSGTLGNAELDRCGVELAREALEGADPATRIVEACGLRCEVYVEAFRAPEELIVVGAGHIAVPLARVGAMLGFRVTVLDDRDEFATEARFPEAVRVERMDFEDPFRGVRIGARSYVVLVTRAHRYDFDCLRRIVESGAEPRYVGMIGSRRRVRAAFEALLAAGVPRAALARVHAPVGLEIGAETPEEIAVSIAAEMVRVRRTGAAGDRVAAPVSEAERVLGRLIPMGGT